MNPLALLGLTGIGGLGATYVVGRALYELGRPSVGAPIDPRARGTALLVLDVQPAFTRAAGGGAPDEDVVASTLKRVDALAHVARRRGWPVIVARRVVRSNRRRLALRVAGAELPTPGSPELELDDRLELGAPEVFDREPGDALHNEALDAYLRERAVGRLLVTGLDGVGSVQRTARAALQRGYEVVLVEDAIASAHPEAWAEWKDRLRGAGAQILPVGGRVDHKSL